MVGKSTLNQKSFPAKQALLSLMLLSALRPTEGGITSADAFRHITSPNVSPGITSTRQRASLPDEVGIISACPLFSDNGGPLTVNYEFSHSVSEALDNALSRLILSVNGFLLLEGQRRTALLTGASRNWPRRRRDWPGGA
ncbi:hypothetical protein RJ60_09425 [Mesotoga sp. B105.6.4]|nr:hypothetical protein RJ60_09425 [Mesotoga sp. B105.6.4]